MQGPEYLDPAWSVTYHLRGFDTAGMLTGWRWTGGVESRRYRLAELASDVTDPTILGAVTVTSWHPYRRDALEDALRAVHDLPLRSVPCSG